MRLWYRSGFSSRRMLRASSMPVALPPMQPVPISRLFIYMRSFMLKYFRHSSRRVGSLPRRQLMMFSFRRSPASSVGSAPCGSTESNMLSQQSRCSPVSVNISNTAEFSVLDVMHSHCAPRTRRGKNILGVRRPSTFTGWTYTLPCTVRTFISTLVARRMPAMVS